MVDAVNYERLTQPERAQLRGEYVKEQGGDCHYCGHSLEAAPAPDIQAKSINWKRFPPNFLRHPVHLHHNHHTGMTIGAVHARCNAVLWQYHGE